MPRLRPSSSDRDNDVHDALAIHAGKMPTRERVLVRSARYRILVSRSSHRHANATARRVSEERGNWAPRGVVRGQKVVEGKRLPARQEAIALVLFAVSRSFA